MASTNKTANLELPQWELSDKSEMADFNDANEKIDTVVSTHLAESVTDAHGFIYEKGTFTPTLTFGDKSTGITYSLQTGVYVRVGDTVTCHLQITLLHKGTSDGRMAIVGLPFTPLNNGSITVSEFSKIAMPSANSINLFGVLLGNSILIRVNLINAAPVEIDHSLVNNTTYIRMYFTYPIN